jgi:hypothetical protein
MILLNSCGNNSENKNNTNTNEMVEAAVTETVNLRLEDIEKEYKENAAAIEEKYKNKFVVFDCTIYDIESGQFHIDAINSPSLFDYYLCWVDDNSEILKLKKGQLVRLKCMISTSGSLHFYKCKVI